MAQDWKGRFLRYWFPVLLYVAMIFTLSSQPHLRPPFRFENSDKLIHMSEYGVLGFLLTRALRTLPRLSDMLRAGLVAIAIGAGIGASDELYQRGIPGRESDVLDFVADSLGVTLSQIAYVWAHRPQEAGRA